MSGMKTQFKLLLAALWGAVVVVDRTIPMELQEEYVAVFGGEQFANPPDDLKDLQGDLFAVEHDFCHVMQSVRKEIDHLEKAI